MRFDSATAHAFGPFRGEVLQLAAGMNVVYGPNEAGKSTWHAALYAGLCGMRRGRGRVRGEDEVFAERHRPWDGDGAWEVGAVVRLEDGRRVQLRHDLAGRVDSSARDVDFAGRDYSNEIMNDGAPDGSRWLGLDRRSFLSTACVRQAAILGLLDDAASLQDELQRAAATAGADETAAQALDRLRAYHAAQVGTERAWTRPLQTSRDAVAQARNAVDSARSSHEDYLGRRSRVDQLEAQVRTLERQAEAVRAALAEAEASRAEERLRRARALSAGFPEGAPRRRTEEDQLAQQVGIALQTWRSSTEPHEPSGPKMSELEANLTQIDQQLGEVGSRHRDVGQGHRPIKWALAGASGLVAGGALALAGLIVPGLIVVLLSLALLGVWVLGRSPAIPASDADGPRLALEAQRAHAAHLIDDRHEAERSYAEAVRERDAAVHAIHRAALAAGVDEDDAEAQVEGLLAWQAHRAEELAEADSRSADWEELQRLLGDRSLQELAAEEARLRADAESLVAQVDGAALTSTHNQAPTAEQVEELRRQVSGAREEWSTTRGQLEQFAQDLPSVAESEEALAAAQRELERVERRDRTLRMTITFLERAEERVHRDIAPVLRETVLDWLPRVTGGRYADCRVNPQTLAVEVCGPEGRWRRAELLSHGTAEQLYLLLRLALARHLTKQGEVCPLILDEAVGACDGDRKSQVLETLLAVSGTVQVILFTHEDDVRDWARERLSGPRDSLIELDHDGVPA